MSSFINPPDDFTLPLTSFFYMKTELAWRFEDLFAKLDDIIFSYHYRLIQLGFKDEEITPPQTIFDPLQTIGKY